MFTFPLIALLATALFLAAVPVVLFALMLETVSQRAMTVAAVVADDDEPRTVRLPLRAAA